MEAVFLKILNMSITASYLVIAVILARLLLKKAPKFITVILWGLVAVRLVCPFSIDSILSLIPSAETVPADIMYAETPQITSGISQINTAVNNIIMPAVTPDATYSANPMQVVIFVASIVWLIGIAAMLLYTLISYIRIRFKVREAVKSQDNIYECDRIDTPFILGIIKPRIYLPSAMAECDREYVIAHERAHIKRRDHLWKPLGFLLLTVYWFNPVLWIAYILLCRDIELACDEKVIKEMGEQSKKPYSEALINCSVPRKMIAACPLAFGETGVKARIKSVLNYKKPAFWVIITAVVLSVSIAVCFMTNPVGTKITNLKDDIDYNDILSDIDELTVMIGENQYLVIYDADITKIIEQFNKVRVKGEPILHNDDNAPDMTNRINIGAHSLCFSKDYSEFCGYWGLSSAYPQSYKVSNPKTAEKIFDIVTSVSKANVDVTGESILTVNNLQYGCNTNGVSVTLKDYNLICDEPYIEFEFANEWETSFAVGGSFNLFYYQDGVKVICAPPKKFGWIASPKDQESAINLEANETKTYKYNLKGYDLSRVGSYRFESDVWVEFELKKQDK
ncbi:MAG: hypothetical protein IJY79_08545 [Clostridia bacterium]|nr:hypothetical protein [Clostridia bacterium]